ncbi:IclR family transcriptional regulator [Alicycliphilus denitrificans]|uniref:IclR family transcriptional regulator n=1 Tax=Alicycliphilus denitrificans TaxID=179636 RepID=A0A3R7FE43_9BURK|nr:IclR family transcriptional regulator [Alicycliphilus denitrificans]RKJ95677.1 IclR family transcriptional regulator [Alicycliphilus denitrificans]
MGNVNASGPQTLRKGLTVLSLLKQVAPEGMGATEVARQTDIDRVTVQRLFLALESGGWVRRDDEGRRYYMGSDGQQLIRSLGSVPGGPPVPLVLAALPAMRRLARQLGDAVFLVARDGRESVCIHREVGDYPLQILATHVGKRYPLGVGSAGMALLAALPERDAQQVIKDNASRLDEYGGITVELIDRLRRNTQQRGYSIMQNYAVRGALGIGCAMTDNAGAPVMSISVSAITDRMSIKRQGEVARLLRHELNSLRRTFFCE